ncbi:MAG TPA: hypothetical protein VFZ69_07080 [Longimicrobiales bacterium]
MSGRAPENAARVRGVICAVVAEAVDAAEAAGVVVLEDWTPEGELVYEWLVDALGEARVWRGASVASNVHGTDPAEAQVLAALRIAHERGGLIAHPAPKTTLLLGGAMPRADLFPLGDLYASQVVALAGGWSVPERLAPVIRRAGGIEAVDAALGRMLEGREPITSALAPLGEEPAREIARLYQHGRYFRLYPRLVPKLSARTLGVDLFD